MWNLNRWDGMRPVKRTSREVHCLRDWKSCHEMGNCFFSSKHIENAFHFTLSFGDLVLHWILGEWQLGHESGLIWFCNEGSRHFCCVVNLLFAFWSFLIHHHITARASKEAPDLFPGRNPAVDWNLAHPKLLTKLWSHSCKCMQGIHRFQDCSARS